MARVYQVPRHAFLWLFAAVLLAALPHLLRVGSWLWPTLLAMLVWRWLIQRGRLRVPGKVLRVLMLVAVTLATLYTHGTLLGPDAGVTLLVAAFALKMVEMFRQRDAYVLVILAFFVLATTFLFSTGPLATLYIGVVMVVVVAALVGINHAESNASRWQHGGRAGVMVLQALPLMLVMFVLVPRLPPLWSMEIERPQSRTGMSDSMAPGEVSRLSRLADVAFRVEFEGPIPAPAERYWRGLTYSWFDGRRWSQAVPPEVPAMEYVRFARDGEPDWYRQLLSGRGEPDWQYRVVMERTGRQWLYALSVPFSAGADIGLARDLRLVHRRDVEERFDYQVSSYRMAVAAEGLEEWERHFYTRLPSGTNPEALAMAREWRAQAPDDAAFIARVLDWFGSEPFYYTLEPPLLGQQAVDDFLFRTRRGFCEHYASAMATLLRGAGIPARVVAGYQGGELNPLGNHLLVRQYDAHAWVEAWLPGQGWREFDPTAAVAPSRIELGLAQTLAGLGDAAAADFGGMLDGIPMMARLTHLADYIQFGWTKWVLGYNQQNQLALLGRWLGEVTPQRMVLALGAAAGLIVLILGLWMLLQVQRRQLTWWQREYLLMERQLRRRGVVLTRAESPAALAARVAEQSPAAALPARQWQRAYEAVAYRPPRLAEAEARRQLRRLRRIVLRRL